MRGEGRRSAWALAVACCMAALLACLGDGGESERRPPVHVPQGWQVARLAPGHAVHVARAQIACEQCHSVASGDFADPGPLPCAACHAKEARIQHASARAQATFGPAAQADCTDCHAFAAAAATPPALASGRDAGDADAAWDCARCHDGHRSDPASGSAVVAHRGAACSACHTPHGDAPAAPADCSACHAALALTHGQVAKAAPHAPAAVATGAPPPLQARCRVCHEALHAPASESQGGCLECHSTTAPVVGAKAVFAGGHERCTSCHAPHGFAKAEAVPCAECHREQPPALAAARVPAHAACASCHRPHDAKADARVSCAGCHQRLQNDHPAPPGGSTCTSCHVAHPRARPGAALHVASARVPCAECHAGATGDGGFHARAVACRECHAPHRFRLAATERAACERCHAAAVQRTLRLGPGHATCRQCHAGLPHDTSGEPRACASCHAEPGARVSAGHRACQGCHEPHAGEVTAACASCHAPVLAGAPEGHRACQRCHEPHSGDQAVAGCTSCHAEKARALHHDVAGGCESCHSAHGPQMKSPPACTSCHQRLASEGALHGVPQHGRCADCHRGHDARPRPEPETCRSCHRDRARHFPEARRCSGCHLFSRL